MRRAAGVLLLVALAAACSSSTHTTTPVPSVTTTVGDVEAGVVNDALAAYNQGGTGALAKQVPVVAAEHPKIVITDVTVRPPTVRGNFTLTADQLPGGVERATGGFAAVVSNGQVLSWTLSFDHHDPQTAKYLAALPTS